MIQCWLSAFSIRVIVILLSPKNSISETISSFNLLMKCQIHTTSLAAYLNVMYSALVINIDTISCFLLLYKITTLLRKNQCLITDFWSSELPAKLPSAYPMRPYRDRSLRTTPSNLCPYINLSYIVFFKYWTTFFATYKWLFLRLELYLLSYPTIKVMSDFVLHTRYINLPIRCWYEQRFVFS